MTNDLRIPVPDEVRRAARTLTNADRPGQLTPRRFLGAGDFASVWLCTQGRQKYALKVWEPDTAETQRSHDEALREAARFGFYDFMPTLYRNVPGASLLEYYEGLPLYQWARTAKADDKLEVVEKVVRYIARWNEAGYQHGDLSGENVIVGPGCTVHILDPFRPSKCSNYDGLVNVMQALLDDGSMPVLLPSLETPYEND